MTDLTPLNRAPATRDTELSDAAWQLIDEATPANTRRAYQPGRMTLVTTPASPDPRAVVEPLVGHRVKLTLTNGSTRNGTVLGCGPSGLTLTSGIGGRMLFYYGEVDAIDDLGTPESPVCICPDIDASRWPGDISFVKGFDPGCGVHGRTVTS